MFTKIEKDDFAHSEIWLMMVSMFWSAFFITKIAIDFKAHVHAFLRINGFE